MAPLAERLARWSGRRAGSSRTKALSTLSGALFFLVLLPLLMSLASQELDARLGLPPWPPRPAGLVSGSALAILGLFLAGWSAWAQLRLGGGTPLPVAPTQRLVTEGPYALCRNPMTLGELLYLTGLGLLLSSPGFLLLTWLILLPAIVAYLKLVEERELEMRFGRAYLAYKEEVPFLIPRPRRRGNRCRGPGGP